MTLEEIKKKIISRLFETFDQYTLDTTELGKVITVASISILLISIPSAIEYKDAYNELEQTNRDLDNLRGVMSTDGFEDGMESIETTLGDSNIPGAGEFRQLHSSFDQMNSTLTELETMETRYESSYQTYQWIILLSIVGGVSGLALIYT